MTHLSIIIPTFNRKDYLKQLLTQIYNLSHGEFEVLVLAVVDGSTDGTFEMLQKEFPQVKVIKGNGEWWYTKSINQGFEYAKRLKPEYVLTLNDDIRLHDDFFINLYKASKESPDSIIGALSLTNELPHRIMGAGIKKVDWWRLKFRPYFRTFTIYHNEHLSGLHPSVVLPGRGMFIPINVINALRGFDEKFPQYHSDTDFCMRAGKNGNRILVSWDVIVYSYIEKTNSGSSYLRTPFLKFISGFFDKHSRIYLPDQIRYINRHGIKILFPVTFVIFILATFKAHFFNKKINS